MKNSLMPETEIKCMKKKTEKKTDSLRERAEARLAKQKDRPREIASTDPKKLVNELDTHQIELEMQNEELRRAQQELETSRNKFAELYDFSPVGYFTIDARGLIREANLTGAELLGVGRRLLTGMPFTVFIERNGLGAYEAHRKDAFKTQTRQTCELRIKPRNAPLFYARLQSAIAANVDDKAGLLRTALIDISERKRAEDEREKVISELQVALREIKTLTGLLPICAWCKKVRNDAGYWQQLEAFVAEHSTAKFSHGMCPECYEKEKERLAGMGIQWHDKKAEE
jgi:PAS domain S-box-containing protein